MSDTPEAGVNIGQTLLKYVGFTIAMTACAIITLVVVEVYSRYRAEAMTRSIGAPDPDSPRPIEARDTLFIEEMTWMEVRDAMKAGKTTVIVASGGVEQCGPYLAMGKHNYICRATTEAIARKLGNALIGSIIPFVPEGDIDPPTEHMKYAGTLSLSEPVYRLLLTDIARCYRTHGFEHIIFIGDSFGNLKGMEAVAGDVGQSYRSLKDMETVAAKLTREWQGGKTRIHYIPEYYNYSELGDWLARQGVEQVREGLHDDFATTAMLMTVDPKLVRTDERLAAGKFRINGIELSPAEYTIAWGRKIIDYRAEKTVAAIRRAIE